MIENRSRRFGYFNGFACVDGVKTDYILTCDICGKEFHFDSFEEAVQYKKDNKWRSRKQVEQWIDICKECEVVR